MLPKYRVWDKATNKMRVCYGFNVLENDIYVSNVANDEFNDRIRTVHAITRHPENVILMQSTGLFDKTGKEIFEGDVLSVISFENKEEFLGEVIFYGGAFCSEIKFKGRIFNMLLTDLVEFSDDFIAEVKGNIYENPELAEGR